MKVGSRVNQLPELCAGRSDMQEFQANMGTVLFCRDVAKSYTLSSDLTCISLEDQCHLFSNQYILSMLKE